MERGGAGQRAALTDARWLLGWMIKVKAAKPDQFAALLDAKAYEKHCAH